MSNDRSQKIQVVQAGTGETVRRKANELDKMLATRGLNACVGLVLDGKNGTSLTHVPNANVYPDNEAYYLGFKADIATLIAREAAFVGAVNEVVIVASPAREAGLLAASIEKLVKNSLGKAVDIRKKALPDASAEYFYASDKQRKNVQEKAMDTAYEQDKTFVPRSNLQLFQTELRRAISGDAVPYIKHDGVDKPIVVDPGVAQFIVAATKNPKLYIDKADELSGRYPGVSKEYITRKLQNNARQVQTCAEVLGLSLIAIAKQAPAPSTEVSPEAQEGAKLLGMLTGKQISIRVEDNKIFGVIKSNNPQDFKDILAVFAQGGVKAKLGKEGQVYSLAVPGIEARDVQKIMGDGIEKLSPEAKARNIKASAFDEKKQVAVSVAQGNTLS